MQGADAAPSPAQRGGHWTCNIPSSPAQSLASSLASFTLSSKSPHPAARRPWPTLRHQVLLLQGRETPFRLVCTTAKPRRVTAESAGNQGKRGVPWRCSPGAGRKDSLASECEKKKEEKELKNTHTHKTAQLCACGSGKNRYKPLKKKAELKIKSQNKAKKGVQRSEYFMRLLFLMFLSLLASPPPPKSPRSLNTPVCPRVPSHKCCCSKVPQTQHHMRSHMTD